MTLTEIKGGGEANLASKMAEIMGELTTIEKRGEFKVDNRLRYTFVRAVDSYEAVQKQLAKHGIALLAEDAEIVSEREKGTVWITTVKVTLRLCDSSTQETMVARWLGSGQDTAEKGVSKAITGAVKSWLLTTFLIPSGVDPDEDGQQSKRQSSGRLPKKDAETLAKLVKAYLGTGLPEAAAERTTLLRLRLRQLGAAGNVENVAAAAISLSKDKATELFDWLDNEVVQAQKGAKT